MRRLRILHETRYDFEQPVQLQPHFLLLRPREGHDIRIEYSKLDISPPSRRSWQRDFYDNSVTTVDFLESAKTLRINSEVVLQHYDDTPLDFVVADEAVNFPFNYDPEAIEVLAPYRERDDANRLALRDWLARFWMPGRVIQSYVLLESLCEAIHSTINYKRRDEAGVQAPALTLSKSSGSCRDTAWLFVAAVRELGLAARFVSGYLYAGNLGDQGGSTHAWAEVYLPGVGWKGFDPSVGALTGADHIAVAVARLPQSVPPVSGSFSSSRRMQPLLTVNVTVDVLETKPLA